MFWKFVECTFGKSGRYRTDCSRGYAPSSELVFASGTPDTWTEPASPVCPVCPDDCMSPATSVAATSRLSSSTQRRARHRCKACDSPFLTASSLEVHARDLCHKTFACSEPGCDKSYCRMDLYTRHKKDHKPSEMHHCAFCPRNRVKSFKRKDHLTQHVRNCHRKMGSPGDTPHLDGPRRDSNTDSTYSCTSHNGDKDNSSVPRMVDDRMELISDTDSVLSALDTRDLIHEMMRRQSEQSTVLRRLEQRLEGTRGS